MTRLNISISASAPSFKALRPAPLRLLLALACGLTLAAPALAADARLPPATAAVIDLQRILQESLAIKSVQQQLESQRSHFQTEIENEENDLRKSEDELAKSRDQMPAATYTDREQQLRQRFLTVEAHVESRRKILDQAYNTSVDSVRDSLSGIVAASAKSHGANIVIVKQQTFWVDPALDITDEVLARLNQKLPNVAVTMPADDAAPATPGKNPAKPLSQSLPPFLVKPKN